MDQLLSCVEQEGSREAPAESRARLPDQIALVTGSGRGVGRAIAASLAAEGAKVILASRSQHELDETAGAIQKAGGTVLAIPTDVRDEAAVSSLVARAEAELGTVTLLINNAGTWSNVGRLEDADPTTWWSDIETSLKGAFLCTRAVLPSMRAAQSGRIVNVSSSAGTEPRPYAIAYSCAKAAVLRLTDSLAVELESSGVRVFAITPGFVRTALIEGVQALDKSHSFLPELSERQDAVDPAEAGRLVVDIASGRLDPLAGRLLHVHDDIDELLRRLAEIKAESLYTLRLARLR